MTAPNLRGVLAPVLTPFRADLSCDVERLIRHSKWLLSQGVGLAPFGTTSEGNSLSVEEKIDLLDRLIESGISPQRFLPGTGSCALPDTVRLSAHATKSGCAGVLMLPPFYYKGVSDDGLFKSYAEVIERVGDKRLRVYLYHIPPVSQVSISVALIERLLAAYPKTVVGIKDSSGDWKNTQAYLDKFASEGFSVFPGSETFLLKALRSGGAGCISATANVNPAAIVRLFQSLDSEDADAQQKALDAVRNVFAKYPLIPALKAALSNYANDPGWNAVRPPLVELSSESTASLLDELDAIRFSMLTLSSGAS